MLAAQVEPSRRSLQIVVLGLLAALMLLPAAAQAESLHVIFPQSAEVTVVQGTSTHFTLEVQAFGATQCAATTVPVVIDTLYSVNAAGAIAPSAPADMPIQTDQTRGTSENCDIKNPVLVPLTATVASTTPVGAYKGVIRYGKGGDGDVDLDGPELTIHVVPPGAAPQIVPTLPPPVIFVLGERAAPKPELGKSVMLTLVSGTVTYVEPGKQVATLTGSVIAPNGTRVDATNGVVKVTVVRDQYGALDSADAWAGAFGVNQAILKGGRGLTTFRLRDGFAPASTNAASAARVRAARSSHKRSLWVNGKGNFKTRGKRASAILRGTYWLTQETDAGTRVAVKHGLVAVRDLVRNRTILVRTGHSYTARPRVHRRVPAFTGSVR